MFGAKNKRKPVYVINGFLDSGKTDFFKYTMLQPYFQTKGLTLVIACEEGENDYDDAFLKKTNAVLERIDSLEDFTPEKLKKAGRLARSRKDTDRVERYVEFPRVLSSQCMDR